MRKQLILEEEDIITEIANAYAVNKDSVSIERYTDTVGYGMMESDVHKVRVVVNFPVNDQR